MNEFKFKSKDELSNFLKSKSGKILEFNENRTFNEENNVEIIYLNDSKEYLDLDTMIADLIAFLLLMPPLISQ